MNDNYILESNLRTALYLAIETMQAKEKAAGYFTDSILVAGLKSNLAALLRGERLEIKYQS